MINMKARYDELMKDSTLGHYEVMQQVFNEIQQGEIPTLEKLIERTCQEAWRQEHNNTTINDMIAWILKKILPEMQEMYQAELEKLRIEIQILKEKIDGDNGRVQKPKGRKGTSNEDGNVRA